MLGKNLVALRTANQTVSKFERAAKERARYKRRRTAEDEADQAIRNAEVAHVAAAQVRPPSRRRLALAPTDRSQADALGKVTERASGCCPCCAPPPPRPRDGAPRPRNSCSFGGSRSFLPENVYCLAQCS